FIFQAQIYQCRRMLFADGVGRVAFACSYVTSGFPPAVSVVFSQLCSSSIQAEVCLVGSGKRFPREQGRSKGAYFREQANRTASSSSSTEFARIWRRIASSPLRISASFVSTARQCVRTVWSVC